MNLKNVEARGASFSARLMDHLATERIRRSPQRSGSEGFGGVREFASLQPGAASQVPTIFVRWRILAKLGFAWRISLPILRRTFPA